VGTLRASLFLLLVAGSASAAGLRLAAAANLNQVLPELVSVYEKLHPDVTVAVSYGASGTLSQQIERGAPYDVFLSASPEYVDYLARRGRVSARRVFARGRLVLYYSKRLNPPPRDLADLAAKKGVRVAVANPEHAPYGRAALSCLRSAGVYEELAGRLVFAANVSQAAQMALHGADAALIALPLARNPALERAGGYLELPQSCHQPLYQEAAVVRQSAAAGSFLDFLASPEAQRLLRAYGYDSP